ncbi:hypothetical protein L3X38_045111 [Prunus dulcis]|uniref:Uncharacterized protein n=1 Tax=Prunus dulcis TaxID=3755 RepID=A0AAD4UZW6_PRUDU|nr:hypothetical protein L3X38_045111 [Prunus dulcis]
MVGQCFILEILKQNNAIPITRSIYLSDHDFAGSSPADSPSGGAPTSPSAPHPIESSVLQSNSKIYTKPSTRQAGPVFQGFLHREENCFVYVSQKLIACASAATE